MSKKCIRGRRMVDLVLRPELTASSSVATDLNEKTDTAELSEPHFQDSLITPEDLRLDEPGCSFTTLPLPPFSSPPLSPQITTENIDPTWSDDIVQDPHFVPPSKKKRLRLLSDSSNSEDEIPLSNLRPGQPLPKIFHFL